MLFRSLGALCRRHPRARFVWLMGADNLIEIPRWQRWTGIFGALPVAVFDRPSYAMRALTGRAARRFAAARLDAERARALSGRRPPVWVFLHTPLDPTSATRVRAGDFEPQRRRRP